MNKREIAEDVSEFWKENCCDDDFYDNCIEDICERLNVKSGPIPDEVYEIWNIIEKEFLY